MPTNTSINTLTFYKRTSFVVALLYFQAFIIGHIQPIHGNINVYVYFFPILFLPINTSVYRLVGICCLLGLVMDIVFDSLGLFMLASAWLGFMRHRLLSLFFVSRRLNSIKEEKISMERFSKIGFIVFLLLFCGVHNLVLISLEWFALTFNIDIIVKWLLDTIYSAGFFLLIYLIFRKVLRL